MFMKHEFLHYLKRYISLLVLLSAIIACDALEFNGANISPAASFPIVYVKRPVSVLTEPVDPVSFAAGGDLYWRDAASASATETNLTSSLTGGKGDVSGPEVSYDGSIVVFSMRRPADTAWNIWTMNVSSKQMTQLTNDGFNDSHPHFLVDGRIVFSSDRQSTSRQQLTNNNIEPFSYLDPKGRHAASLLHVMDADGTNIRQISFHVGHDTNVTLLNSGKIIFNRWEASGQRSHIPVISMNPDGTEIETLYGAYSKGNSFLQPRQLVNGKMVAIQAPISGAHGGGALVEVDIEQYGDMRDWAVTVLPGSTKTPQKQLSLKTVNIEAGVSEYGRFLSPYPVFDNSNRILVSWSASNKTEITDPVTSTTKTVEGNPSYGVYIMDLGSRSMRPVVKGENGKIAYQAIAIQARTPPTQIDDATSDIGGKLDAVLEAADQGVIHVRSIYDTDDNGLLGPSMMVGTEQVSQIPSTANDTRAMVADVAAIKDLTDPNYRTVEDRPARFVRVTTPVAVPEGAGQDLVGEAGSVMQRILGYSEVEPDGSVLFKVPADTPVAISVLDANGRAITNHSSWMQVRPGEILECSGCHSPRKHTALNTFPVTINKLYYQLGASQINETMAETRARTLNGDRNNPDNLNPDIFYTDLWVTDIVTASAAAGMPIQQGFDIDIDYSLLTTATPTNGVINFVDHIQPVLDANCVACHNGGQTPDLQPVADTDGVLLSYKNLVKGVEDPDPVTPTMPLLNLKDGAYLTQRQVPYIRVGGPRDNSRSSYLFEKLYNTELLAPRALTGGTDHTAFLNASELRLMTEWVDSGANYYNNPFAADNNPANGISDIAEIRNRVTLPDYNEFKSNVFPVLQTRCASCHKSIGNKSDFKKRIVASTLANAVPSENTIPKFILTGNVEGDYRATSAFIEDRATPSQNTLITRSLSTGTAPVHPQISDGAGGFIPVLLNTDADYTTLINWITP